MAWFSCRRATESSTASSPRCQCRIIACISRSLAVGHKELVRCHPCMHGFHPCSGPSTTPERIQPGSMRSAAAALCAALATAIAAAVVARRRRKGNSADIRRLEVRLPAITRPSLCAVRACELFLSEPRAERARDDDGAEARGACRPHSCRGAFICFGNVGDSTTSVHGAQPDA